MGLNQRAHIDGKCQERVGTAESGRVAAPAPSYPGNINTRIYKTKLSSFSESQKPSYSSDELLLNSCTQLEPSAQWRLAPEGASLTNIVATWDTETRNTRDH